jgi:hypothetical protein
MKFHWNFMKKKGPLNEIKALFYRLIGKLTAFLQLQEFSLRKPTVACSTSAARLSLNNSKTKLV